MARRRRHRINPRRKYRRNPRRHYRRNPFAVGGIASTLKAGVKDGAVVLVAQVIAKRAIGFVAGFNPLKGLPGAAVTGLGTATVITIAARKFAPNLARLISAVAFAEGMRGVLMETPVGPFLGDYSAGIEDGYGAWAQIPAPGVGAWANGMGAVEEEYAQ